MAEWEAPAAVLSARPYGEADVVATVLTREGGLSRGLVRGGQSRRHAGTWQPGNLVTGRWVSRLADALGTLTGELVHPGAALAMDDVLPLAVLASACAVAEGALPEREPHPRVFDGLVHLVAHLGQPGAVAALVRWEAVLLSELGYGLDLSCCAVSGRTEGLAYVSPRTGRAVCAEEVGPWRERLLALPTFIADDTAGSAPAWTEGLQLTGHFLARDAFGHHHRPLPPARDRLERLVMQMAVMDSQSSTRTKVAGA